MRSGRAYNRQEKGCVTKFQAHELSQSFIIEVLALGSLLGVGVESGLSQSFIVEVLEVIVRGRGRVMVRVRATCFIVTRKHKGVLCVRQRCRGRGNIWPVAGRKGVQHAAGDDGRARVRLGLDNLFETRVIQEPGS